MIVFCHRQAQHRELQCVCDMRERERERERERDGEREGERERKREVKNSIREI